MVVLWDALRAAEHTGPADSWIMWRGDPMTLTSGVELPVDRIAEICRRYGVKELAVFGSATRLDMDSSSDIDILVDFESNARIGFVRFAALAEELEALLCR